MNVICYPSALSGKVRAIVSKSDMHRHLICAALSSGTHVYLGLKPPFCDDITATIRCLEALGATFEEHWDGMKLHPIKRQPHADLDCGESGSTLRNVRSGRLLM